MYEDRKMSEHTEQGALFQWARINARDTPELELLHAIPNAQKFGSASKQQKINTIRKMKDEGLTPGIPDVCLPIVVNKAPNVSGILYIEMKWGKNKPTKSQEDMMKKLSMAGNTCIVCWSWINAAIMILNHIAMHRMQTKPAAELHILNEMKETLKRSVGIGV